MTFPRGAWIVWSDKQRRRNLQWIVDHIRFLILPCLCVNGLASKILALSTRKILNDLGDPIPASSATLETLVDTARFRGICYDAASWIYVGQTARRGRMDREHKAHGQAVKGIYVYPLVRSAALRLCEVLTR